MFVLALDSEAACTGKTTTLRVLASAFIAANRTVFIANAAMAENGTDGHLGDWAFKLLGKPDEPQLLDYRHIRSPEVLVETVQLQRRLGNTDFLIIDTNKRKLELASVARKYADLTLIPTIQRNSGGGAAPKQPKSDNFRLSYQALTKANGPRPLYSMLPASEIFANQSEGGHVPDMLRILSERTRKTTKSPSRHKVSFVRRESAKAAWSSAQSLAWEIDWLTRGYGLSTFDAPVGRIVDVSKS